MRKTFKLFCAAALAALAVSSCYDDTFLRGEIDRLDGRVDSLASVLNKDVANLAALQSSVTTLETSLKQAIADGDAAVKKALEDALAAAQADLKKVKSDLEAAIAAGDKANADALKAEVAKVEKSLKALTDAIDLVGSDLEELTGGLTSDVEALEAALKALEATVGTNYKDLLKKLDEVDGVVDGHIADMKTALDALAAADEKFNKDLAAAIAKIVVSKVEEVNGKIVLTLADGKTVELSKPLSNVDNSGLVTIVEVEGVKYWSVVGAETHTGVPVGHPDYKLDFQINGTTNELEYRVNNGEWISTGVKVEATAENVKVITGFENAEDYVKITIAGSEVVLPKYVAEDLTASLDRESMFVSYGKSKTVTLTVADADEYYVMSKPDGWKAKFDEEGVLTVTAPTAKAVESDVAELEGEVLVHANTASGKCTVVKLDVKTGIALTVNMNLDNSLEIFNAITYTRSMGWAELTFFADLTVGLVEADVYEDYDDFEEFINAAMDSEIEFSMLNIPESGEYVSGEYEEDKMIVPSETLFENLDSPLNPATKYVIFALPQTLQGYLYEDAAICYYETTANVEINTAEGGIKFNDILVDINIEGVTSYYVGVINKDYTGGLEIDDYLTNNDGPFGYMKAVIERGLEMQMDPLERMGTLSTEIDTELSLADINYGEPILPNSTYYFWVFPIYDGKDLADYTYERDLKPYAREFTSSALVSGGEATVTFEDEPTNQTYTSVVASASASEESVLVYYYAYSSTAFNEITDLASDLLSNGVITEEQEFMVQNTTGSVSLSAGESVVFAALAVDENGKYGAPVYKTYTTKSVVVNSQLSATLTPLCYTYKQNSGDSYTTVYVKVSSENENLKSIRYVCSPSSEFSVDQNALAYSTGTEQSVTYLTNGYFKLAYRTPGENYKIGYVCIDNDGKVSAYNEVEFTTPTEPNIISATQKTPDSSIYNPEQRVYSTNATGTLNKVDITVNVPEGSMAWWALNNNVEVSGNQLVHNFVTGLYSGASWFAGTKTQQFNCGASKTGYKFYLVIMDAEGNYTYYVEDIDAYIADEKAKLQ